MSTVVAFATSPTPEWSEAEILACVAASTVKPEPAWVPNHLERPQLRAYLAARFPELRYAYAETEPGLEMVHVWLDPASGSWVQMTENLRWGPTIRSDGPRTLLYEDLICAIGDWNRDGRPDVRDVRPGQAGC
ncbi:hypothetical protein BAY61_31870 (plasmid) [Prauserella marina]|uniref:Uncharacterized protein n=1 Tax=Prauserella marina TaxID=530584 RepID=A0A222W163_9PSEU|nr:hypothetical protein [Prauserella marina]ASR39885.1 hypothetical protein BAY61_31870 [Prauserella marina]PWV71380.1 hypothetical protein DES30_11296 [Prauserella marina]SDD95392.1 hypothetical protein SAMN05421630_11516 [Prauserella marina]